LGGNEQVPRPALGTGTSANSVFPDFKFCRICFIAEIMVEEMKDVLQENGAEIHPWPGTGDEMLQDAANA
jgi:hypothetical protein